MIETVLGVLIILYGTVYALFLLRAVWKDRANAAEEPGTFWKVSVCEAVVYFFTTMGVPDFILNTTDMTTTLLCAAAIAAGSLMGARVMTALPAEVIRKIMAIAMLASMGAMVLKLVVSSGAAGTGTALAPWQMCIALPAVFGLGFLNMFGVPMKPPAIALLLLMGLSPINTLTLMLVMGVVSPMAGGIRVLRSALYQKKIVLAAVSFGALGALAGTAFTVTLPAGVLTAVLLVIMAFTSVSMLRKRA